MLYADNTVTFIRCDGVAYTTFTTVGVSWYAKSKIATEGNGLKFADTVQIRIQTDNVTTMPEVGDQVIFGTMPEEFVVEKPADLASYNPRTVMTVGDNRRGNLAHVAVVC